MSHSSVLVNLYFAILRMLYTSDPMPSIARIGLVPFFSLFYRVCANASGLFKSINLVVQNSEPISDFSRLGGALGHLLKTVEVPELVEKVNLCYPTDCNLLDTLPLDVVCIDAAVLFYHLGVSSRFKAAVQQQNVVQQSLEKANGAQAALSNSNNNNSESSDNSNDSTAANSNDGTQAAIPPAESNSVEGERRNALAALHTSLADSVRLLSYYRTLIVSTDEVKQPHSHAR